MAEIKGLSFPFRIGGRGSVLMSGDTTTEQRHIKESIMALVGTREYERVMNPYRGLEDLDMFFNDFNETTKSMAEFKVREKLALFEPRVEVMSVDISEVKLESGIGYYVTVSYRVLASGEISSVTTNF